MNILKTLTIFAFMIFLIGGVSAFGIIGGAFDDGSENGVQSITISEGDSINFNYDFISNSSPMVININLYDSQDEIIISFTQPPLIITTPCPNMPSYVCYTGEEHLPSNLDPGNYELIMFADTIGKSKTLYLTVQPLNIPDTNPPIITLLGDNPVNIALGSDYVEAGATAYDQEDGDLTSQINISGDVDTTVVGTYFLTYSVQDSSGNTASSIRTINVYNPGDITAPIIKVITPEQEKDYSTTNLLFEIEVNEVSEVSFVLDNNPSINMNYQGFSTGVLIFTYNITLTQGAHEVAFYATDAMGNTATKTIEFSINWGDNGDDKIQHKKTNNLEVSDNYEDELYFDQFKPKKIIYLEEEDKPVKLTWWQRFVAWLKKIFGFD